MNAHCERVIGGIRREVLDHVLIMGEAHARHVLASHQDHYDMQRPHQDRDQLSPAAQEHPATVHDLDTRRLLRTRILGGLVNEYRHAAWPAAMTFRAAHLPGEEHQLRFQEPPRTATRPMTGNPAGGMVQVSV
ncbi:integrase core domain-containing protein [Saccharothrix deserti]|uniref:integrase core domain-containing protein n=1 Tax=Saccharothrix deserti TaxID=2593674 RepID=UPI00192E3215